MKELLQSETFLVPITTISSKYYLLEEISSVCGTPEMLLFKSQQQLYCPREAINDPRRPFKRRLAIVAGHLRACLSEQCTVYTF